MRDIIKIAYKATGYLIFACLVLLSFYFLSIGLKYVIVTVPRSKYKVEILAGTWILLIAGYKFMSDWTIKNS